MPVPQRLARAPYLRSTSAVTVAPVTVPSDDLTAEQRRGLSIELAIVLVVTFGLSAYTAILGLIESVLRGLAEQSVALNPRRSEFSLIDLGLNLASIAQLVAWGALGVYLLWRSGFGPRQIGLGRPRWRSDGLGGLGLAAAIGLPGLGLYLAGRALGLSVSVVPSGLDDHWWTIPTLLLAAFANGWAEEVIVVAYLLTRLRQLRIHPVVAVLAASLLRGTYHLYQGYGAGLGNVAMGVIFGLVWLRTGRLWPLIVAHGLIDAVAFVGYGLAAEHVDWLT